MLRAALEESLLDGGGSSGCPFSASLYEERVNKLTNTRTQRCLAQSKTVKKTGRQAALQILNFKSAHQCRRSISSRKLHRFGLLRLMADGDGWVNPAKLMSSSSLQHYYQQLWFYFVNHSSGEYTSIRQLYICQNHRKCSNILLLSLSTYSPPPPPPSHLHCLHFCLGLCTCAGKLRLRQTAKKETTPTRSASWCRFSLSTSFLPHFILLFFFWHAFLFPLFCCLNRYPVNVCVCPQRSSATIVASTTRTAEPATATAGHTCRWVPRFQRTHTHTYNFAWHWSW